jgi:hypothetical protein
VAEVCDDENLTNWARNTKIHEQQHNAKQVQRFAHQALAIVVQHHRVHRVFNVTARRQVVQERLVVAHVSRSFKHSQKRRGTRRAALGRENTASGRDAPVHGVEQRVETGQDGFVRRYEFLIDFRQFYTVVHHLIKPFRGALVPANVPKPCHRMRHTPINNEVRGTMTRFPKKQPPKQMSNTRRFQKNAATSHGNQSYRTQISKVNHKPNQHGEGFGGGNTTYTRR